MAADKRAIGLANGIIAGMSFGLIPLFSIPLIEDGMGNVSILVYRFLFGCATMLAVLIYRQTDMRVCLEDLLRIALLSVFYIGTAITTLECYHYLSSGIATALVYTDPIWCSIIGLLFLREKFSLRLLLSVVFATVGVMTMTGVFSEDGTFSLTGLFWGLMSGLSYALYLIFVPRLRIGRMPSLKLAFYVFFIGGIILLLYALATTRKVETTSRTDCWICLLLLGAIPTALSNICVTNALKLIHSTVVAILGALEPLTALAIGIALLGDPYSLLSISGAMLILIAVAIVSLKKE